MNSVYMNGWAAVDAAHDLEAGLDAAWSAAVEREKQAVIRNYSGEMRGFMAWLAKSKTRQAINLIDALCSAASPGMGSYSDLQNLALSIDGAVEKYARETINERN